MTSTLDHAIIRGIRAERTRLDLTQQQLADKLHWSRKTIVAIEGGDRKLLAHELADVCRALGITLRVLLVSADDADLEALGMPNDL